ncbi:MAG: four helix bundle protein [Sulfuricella sp.]|nr:four helix bundle protein [Sulfuricella sp.]
MANGKLRVANPKPHQRLEVWQQAILLVKETYSATAGFPKEEMFGLVSQMRRAAVSIPSNIAEGAAREGDKEYLHFLSIARGSLSELDTQAHIASMLGYLAVDHQLNDLIDRVGRLLSGFSKKLKTDVTKP